MKAFKYFIQQVIVGLLVIGVVLFFVSPSPMQNVGYLRGEQLHYRGTSLITADQFVDIISEYGWFFFDEYERQPDGLVLVEYDRYAPIGIPNLTQEAYAVSDMPVLTTSAFVWVEIAIVTVVIVAVLFICGILSKFLGVSITPRKADRFFGAVLYKILRVWDNLSGKKNTEGAIVVKDISLDAENLKGIVAVRTWRSLTGSSLRSTAHRTVWKGKVIVADKTPERENDSGLYAFRVGSARIDKPIIGLMFGVVEMSGDFEYHGDGVVRAERCEIKLLVCHGAYYNKGRRLSAKYGVPVCFTDNPTEAYHNWIFGENGMECLEHNHWLLEKRASIKEVRGV